MPKEHQAEKHNAPRQRYMRHQDDARHDGRGEANRDFPRQVHRTPAMNQPARQAAAQQTSHTRRRKGYPGDRADALDVEPARIEQILGQPENVEVPRRIA